LPSEKQVWRRLCVFWGFGFAELSFRVISLCGEQKGWSQFSPKPSYSKPSFRSQCALYFVFWQTVKKTKYQKQRAGNPKRGVKRKFIAEIGEGPSKNILLDILEKIFCPFEAKLLMQPVTEILTRRIPKREPYPLIHGSHMHVRGMWFCWLIGQEVEPRKSR
jgi:hypothetical protein